MRVLLFGCLAMAEAWDTAVETFPSIRGRAEIVGIVDPNRDQRAAFAAANGLTDLPSFDDLPSAIAEVEADAVFDVTPAMMRPHIVRTALNAGLNVLTVKPMAPSMEEARAREQLGREQDSTFAVIDVPFKIGSNRTDKA